jgi:hypothetical protein
MIMAIAVDIQKNIFPFLSERYDPARKSGIAEKTPHISRVFGTGSLSALLMYAIKGRNPPKLKNMNPEFFPFFLPAMPETIATTVKTKNGAISSWII